MRDAVRKGRKGILTIEDVRAIRAAVADIPMEGRQRLPRGTVTALKEKYGVSNGAISGALRDNWKHVK